MRIRGRGTVPESLERRSLSALVQSLPRASVLVAGDIMLDRFTYGGITRISPEAPVPVFRVERIELALGGAGNVVRNLAAVNARPSFAGAVGADPEGEVIDSLLREEPRTRYFLAREQGRQSTVKTRFVAERQQVLRVDSESSHPLTNDSIRKSLDFMKNEIAHCQAAVLSDYGKGFLSREVIEESIAHGRRLGKPVIVDPKGTDYRKYRGATLLTPNLKELAEASRLPVDSDEAVVAAATHLLRECGVANVLATRGREGMSLVQRTGEVTHLRSEAREVFDVSGAGDTVIAVLSAALAAGASLPDAAALANVAAGIVVGKVGTAVVRPDELLHTLQRQQLSSAESKVLTFERARETVGIWRRNQQKIGFTNGFFDLLHPGHLSLLHHASESCDRLIVGLNSDQSLLNVKGEEPYQDETTRAAILASLEMVDMVVIFHEDTPTALLRELRPDVLVKGANYRPEEIVGADVVRSYGGEVIQAEVFDFSRMNGKLASIVKGSL